MRNPQISPKQKKDARRNLNQGHVMQPAQFQLTVMLKQQRLRVYSSIRGTLYDK